MTDPLFKSRMQESAVPGQSDLTVFDHDYAAVEPLANVEVPDGKYDVRIEHAILGRSRKGDPMLTFDMVVLSGLHANRHVFKNSVITQASLPVVKKELERLGLDLERLSDLPSRLQELVGITLKITKRTKDEYENVYFNKPTEPF